MQRTFHIYDGDDGDKLMGTVRDYGDPAEVLMNFLEEEIGYGFVDSLEELGYSRKRKEGGLGNVWAVNEVLAFEVTEADDWDSYPQDDADYDDEDSYYDDPRVHTYYVEVDDRNLGPSYGREFRKRR